MDINNLKNIRLCTTKNSIKDTPELKKLKTTDPTKYRLISDRLTVWPNGQILKIKFFNSLEIYFANEVTNTNLLFNESVTKVDGQVKVGSNFDPLQLQFNNEYKNGGQNITSQNIQKLVIKYTIRCIIERWAPFVNLNFQFALPAAFITSLNLGYNITTIPNNSDCDIRISFVPVSSQGGVSVLGKAALTETLCGAQKNNNQWEWNSDEFIYCEKLGYTKSNLPSLNPLYLVASDIQKQPTLNISSFSINNVLHEFGHALGFDHEHQSICGRNIEWNLPLLYSWTAITMGWDEDHTTEQIVNQVEKDTFIGSSYDKDSIMIYSYPKELTLNNIGTPYTLRLSPNDCITASLLYPKSPQLTIDDIKTKYLQMYPENILSSETQKQFTIRFYELKRDGLYNITQTNNINIFIIVAASVIGFLFLILFGLFLKKNFFKRNIQTQF